MHTILTRTALAGTLLVTTLLPAAFAAGVDPQCKLDAKEEKAECVAICKEQFQIDKDLCRNVDHECAEACRAGRTFCLYGDEATPGPLAVRDACKAACKATQEAAKDDCRALYAEGTPELGTCLADANLDAYLCRQPCRTGVAEAVKLCRQINRVCMRACPPAIVE